MNPNVTDFGSFANGGKLSQIEAFGGVVTRRAQRSMVMVQKMQRPDVRDPSRTDPTTPPQRVSTGITEPDGGTILDHVMTAEQIAELLHMRVSTIQGYARRGLLPSVKVGRGRRFIRYEVERAVLSLSSGS